MLRASDFRCSPQTFLRASTMRTFLFVIVATILEASGDAVIRQSIHSHILSTRIILFLTGAILLAGYGTSLNLAPVEFASVTGIYVAMLIVMFQLANYVFFRTVPSLAAVAGCGLVIAGGLIIFFFG